MTLHHDDNNAQVRSTLHDRGICVVIPTYNNHATIRQVVESVFCYCSDVIVVDDGCTDSTADILGKIEGITVVSCPHNRGKGHALKLGFKRALQLGFSYAITLDADGQHFADDIPAFLKKNQEHPGSLIVGNRDLRGVDRSGGSSFANKFSNFWFWVQTGRALPDTQTGYRLYPLKKLKGLSLLTSRYEAELELMVFASWHGVEICTVPVKVFYPPRAERVSHFRPAIDFGRISLLNTVLCALAVVYGLPLRLWRMMMRYLRTGYSIAFFLINSCILTMPIVWFETHTGPMTNRKRDTLRRFIHTAARFIMVTHGIPGTKFVCRKPANIDFSKPRVIICNHQSHLDLMCQLAMAHNMVFLTNDWVWNNPCYGSLIRNAEYLPATKGMDAIMPQIRSLVERGCSIAVYPEGTRSRDGSVGRFHQGAFYIAQQLGLEVLPMYLYGANKVLKKKTYHLNKGQIYIEVGQPVRRDELERIGDTRHQALHFRSLYKQKIEQLSNKIDQDA